MIAIEHHFTYRQKDKGWQVILSYKDGSKWRQKSKQGLRTKQLAKAAGEKLLKELQKTFVPSSSSMADMTLREFIPIFLRDHPELSYSRQQGYNALIPFFREIADTPMRSIKTKDIIAIMADSSHYAANTKESRLTTLRSLYNYAKKNYDLPTENPTDKVPRIKKKEVTKIKVIAEKDFIRLVNTIKSIQPQYTLAVQIAYYTGMRYGEILGLTWNDVDFDRATVTINKQIKKKKGGTEVGVLKTLNSYRTIPIPPALVLILRQQYKRYGNSVTGLTNPITAQINYYIKTVLPNNSIHDFRHTYATNLLSHGLDVKTVAAMLGDTVATIIKTYVHFTEDMRLHAADKIGDIFG